MERFFHIPENPECTTPDTCEALILTSKVAAVGFNGDAARSLKQALPQIGGIDDLDTAERSVVIKVGVFSHKAENHTSVNVLNSIINVFDKAPKIYIAESDNYQGTGTERLQIWKELFTKRVVPFNLSDDPNIVKARIANQEMSLPRILYKPNVLVSTHILRSFESGSILKNLFGCILDTKRAKYHKTLPKLLADVYEAIGGIDLAILDGTRFWHGAGTNPVQTDTVLIGRDAVAVETVGAALAGLNPEKMPILQEFVKRNLGEGNLDNIEIVGASFENLKNKFTTAAKAQRQQKGKRIGATTWGGKTHNAFKALVDEGFFKQPSKRTIEDVIDALEARGLPTNGKEPKIADILARRVKRGILEKHKTTSGKAYWTN
jgi:uncharacterized protein (DUF362 family)